MGRDKALLPAGDGPLALARGDGLAALGEVYYSVDRAGRFACLRGRELPDPFPGQGPLNGLVAAFEQTDADRILLTAVDMPLAGPAAAARLLDEIGDADVCCREGQPLFGLYTRACLAPARQCLQTGRRSFRELFARLRVRELPLLPEEERWYLNLNTPEDYRLWVDENQS